ncbi:MAG: amidohydrolase [Candidatus Cloacimonetes bacterium]|nr:amidohydrolase [Candidatus Cloacimonadota bacterium]
MLDLIKIREDLHRIPELGFLEHKTHACISEALDRYPDLERITFDVPGVLAVYRNGDGPFKLFRADMDALPIVETTGVSFSSTHSGMMHACGHDIHMTVLLGLIDQVCTQRLPGNFLFLFQPAEEGRGGARHILGAGHLDGFDIKACYALHVSGQYPVGTVASRPGIFFGIPQEFKVTFCGQSAHAAFPHQGNNALDAGVMFYQSMRAAMAQRFSPTDAVVFHVGRMTAGRVMNAVPDLCEIEGTTRSLTRENRDLISHLIEHTALHASGAFELKGEVEFLETFDPVMNDTTLLKAFRVHLPENVCFEEAPIVLTGEDFGFFTTRWPGLLFWLGAGVESGDLHTSTFLPHNDCIDVGVRALESLARSR